MDDDYEIGIDYDEFGNQVEVIKKKAVPNENGKCVDGLSRWNAQYESGEPFIHRCSFCNSVVTYCTPEPIDPDVSGVPEATISAPGEEESYNLNAIPDFPRYTLDLDARVKSLECIIEHKLGSPIYHRYLCDNLIDLVRGRRADLVIRLEKAKRKAK